MSEVINLTIMKSAIDNKELQADSDGYYLVTLGAFNVYNSAGEVYSFDGVRELLNTEDNVLNRRLLKGRLRSEVEHPKRLPGMSNNQFILRNLEIPLDSTCAHIKEVRIKETNVSENIPGIGNVVIIEGLVKPSGPYSDALKQSLDNPNEDTCFSIRSFTENKLKNGLVVKYIKQIVTWDWVNEPGIKYASKLNSPQVESIDIASYNIDDLVKDDKVAECVNCSIESKDQEDMLKELADNLKSDNDIVNKWM